MTFETDRVQAGRQLRYLGYNPGGDVYLRFFFPKWDARVGAVTSARKLSQINWPTIEQYQSEGRGVYVVVNGAKGGHKDSDITQCYSLFCEWDDISLTEQEKKWREIGFIEPTFTIYSGGKSLQQYWVFDEPIDVYKWRELQLLLITALSADVANKNPARVFRLAGGWYIQPEGEKTQTRFVQDSGILYSSDEISKGLFALAKRSLYADLPLNNTSAVILPVQGVVRSFPDFDTLAVPVPVAVPLECALGAKSRDLLSGVAEGSRHVAMVALAKDLIGTEAEFRRLGQSTGDDAYSLFVDACRRCATGNGWSDIEWERIWQSMLNTKPTASVSKAAVDAVANCIRGWYLRNPINRDTVAKKPLIANAKIPTVLEIVPTFRPTLESEIDELFALDLKESQLQIKIFGLAQKYRLGGRELLKIYELREAEKESVISQETASEVNRLLDTQAATLDLSEVIPASLAEPIKLLAATLNLKAECYLLALLVQCGSLLKASTSTMLYPQSDFRCGPNYFGAIVAEVSQKKTPIIRAIISDPMEKIQYENREAYSKLSIAYEEVLNVWKNSKEADRGAMPVAPVQKVYSFTKATGEGISTQAQKLPEQSMLYLCDELAGAFKSANQYRGGKGSDEEDLLEYWSGGGAVVLRVGGLVTDVSHVSLSILGNIQPKVLAGFIGNGDDNNGKFARFDFVQQPLAATTLRENAPNIDLTPVLTAVYERLDAIPPTNFRFNREARLLFIKFYNHCEEERKINTKQGMRGMWGKAPLKVGKIATILHCLYSAYSGDEISESITIRSVRAAIKFVRFTIDQSLSLNLEICHSEDLAPNLAKIISLADRKECPISVSDIRAAFNSKYRPTAREIRQMIDQLVAMEYGVFDVDKGTFLSKRPKRPKNGETPLPEPIESVQENVQITSKNVQNDSEDLQELLTFIKATIAENDSSLAQSIKVVLSDVCGPTGTVKREDLWAELTVDEREALTLLLSQPDEAPSQLSMFAEKPKKNPDPRFDVNSEDWS